MRRIHNIKIGISGIRGIIGESLSPEQVVSLTRAFSTLIGHGRVAVAKDSRLSGDTIKRAVFAGLIFSGITPVDTFTLPTPSLEIFVKEKKLSGGIIITASHNTEEWNGLKFVDKNGMFLSPFAAQNMIDIYYQGSFRVPSENEFPDVEEEGDAFRVHKEKVLKIINLEKIRKKRFKVLADPGGGVGAFYDREFLEELGCEVHMINHKISPRFPRHPEPTSRNLAGTSEYMKGRNFDIGFAQDSDGDRLCILDEKGKSIGGELTLASALYGYLANKEREKAGAAKGGKIVINLSTSRVIDWVAQRFGCTVLKSPVGEINVSEMMLKEGAAAGGEGNGGVIIPEIHLCRDSFTGMALVLDAMASMDKKISGIVDQFPKYERLKRKIPLAMSGASRIISILKEEYPDADLRDGMRVDKEITGSTFAPPTRNRCYAFTWKERKAKWNV